MPSTTQLITMVIMVFPSVLVGYHLGSVAGARFALTTQRFVILNVVALLICVVAGVIASVGPVWIAVPLLAGCCALFVGLKAGAPRSDALWARHDQAFQINVEQRKRAAQMRASHPENRSAADRQKQEFISVPGDASTDR